MRAFAVSKLSNGDVDYGVAIGGAQGSTPPNAVNMLTFENVTQVTITGSEILPLYGIWHKTGDDAAEHQTQLDARKYNLMVTNTENETIHVQPT